MPRVPPLGLALLRIPIAPPAKSVTAGPHKREPSSDVRSVHAATCNLTRRVDNENCGQNADTGKLWSTSRTGKVA